jgi:hypothetical protein
VRETAAVRQPNQHLPHPQIPCALQNEAQGTYLAGHAFVPRKEHGMIRISRLALPFLAALLYVAAAGGTAAQSVGADEAVGPGGTVTPNLTLTPVQRRAIYNAVARQRVQGSGRAIVAAIGAPVPPSAALRNLPDQAAGIVGGGFLKYAMVDDDVVLVDAIRMQVIDVIHGRLHP